MKPPPHPTTAQQMGLTFAPMPIAMISFFSSSYVVWHLLRGKPTKLERLYHRLVLAMNVAILPFSFTFAWSTFAVPEGTSYYYGASGTIATCTTQGFLFLMFGMAVPTYYASLSLQAFMGIKNNFKEEKYQWIEKYIHLFAFCIPCACAIYIAATENFNPYGSGCYIAKSPQGCETDLDVPCQRGEDIEILELTVELVMMILYLVFPPSTVIIIYFWIDKMQREMRGSTGMQQIRDSVRMETMKNILIQISKYLFSFWFTWVFNLAHAIYQILTRELLYGLLIVGNCAQASQGFVFAMVYFVLQKLGKPKVEFTQSASLKRGLTVRDIRSNAERTAQRGPESAGARSESSSSLGNIFDGVPDEDSPWARFIDQDDYDNDNVDASTETEWLNDAGQI